MIICRLWILLCAIWLSGCATYGAGIDAAIIELQKGDYAASEAIFKQKLSPTGNDRFLYYAELGLVQHLAGDFHTSNELLSQAELIGDELERISLSDSIITLMSNPRLGPYGGAEFEHVFINYYKALNYLGLANLATTKNERLDALENARVESRRLIIRLNDITSRKNEYPADDEDAKTFASILSFFTKILRGNLVDMDSIQYRDDAMGHYLTGISFEMNGELDNARISYQKAATAYQNGYAKQYRLGDDITQQAWFDTIRVMRQSGGYESEWRALAAQKLTEEQRAELELWHADSAQVVVLEHKGLIPHRQEMNILLTANNDIQSFQLRPYFISSKNTNELNWFYMLYADRGIAGLVTAYLDAVNLGLPLYGFTKTMYLGPLWKQVEDLGLNTAIAGGVRVTVPYYNPVEALPESTVTVNSQPFSMYKSSNPALIALQEQMLNANRDIQVALTRGIVKARTAQGVSSKAGNYSGLVSILGSLAAQLSDAAETRNWLLLPHDIRLRRIRLDSGEHELHLASTISGSVRTHNQHVQLEPGQIYLWQVRTLPILGHTPHASGKNVTSN